MAKKKISSKIRPGRGADQFMVRLPDGMRDRLAAMAARHGRSMNAEIVSALIAYIAYDGEIDRTDPTKNESARAVIEAEVRAELRRLFEIMKEEAINTGYLPPGAKVPPLPPDIPSLGAERQSKKKPTE
jgi:hypothetical protein